MTDIIELAKKAELPCQHPDWIEGYERFAALVLKAEADETRARFAQPAQPEALAEPVKQEPVEIIVEVDRHGDATVAFGAWNLNIGSHTLYAAPVDAKAIDFDTWMKHPYTIELNKSVKEDYIPATDAKAIRAEALEEAAKWLAESGLIGSNDCAAAIRGLK